MDKAKADTLKSLERGNRRANRIRAYHVAAFVFTFFLLLALLVMIWMMFVAGNLVTSFLVEEQTDPVPTPNSLDANANSNLIGGVKSTFAQISEFLEAGVSLGNASSAGFLISFNGTFMVIKLMPNNTISA